MSVMNEREKLLVEFCLSNVELFIKVLPVFKPEYFEVPLNSVVEFALKYYNDYQAIPKIEIVKVETGVTLVNHQLDKDEIEYTTDAIEDHCKNEAMKLAILESVDKYLPVGDFGSIQNAVKKALSVSIDKSLGLNIFEDPKTRLLMMNEDIDARSIGWPSIDVIIESIKRGELFLVAGGSGSGKSVVLSNIAKNLAHQKLNVVYVTLELKDSLVAKRLDSIITEIGQKDIFDSIDDVALTLKNTEAEYGNFHVKKMPNGANSNDIRSYLLEYKLQFGFDPDVICVDYLDLMSTNSQSSDGVFEKDKQKSEELREIFIDYNAYGFSASQLNRESVGVVNKDHSHIAGGISKINTSDVTIAINRTQEHIDKGEIEFQFLKLRNAALVTTPVTLYFNPLNLIISETQSMVPYMSDRNKVAKEKLETLLKKGKKNNARV